MKLKRETEFHGRMSCDRSDPGYVNWGVHFGACQAIRVYLDNVEQKNVRMADTEAGEILRPKMDASGHFLVAGDDIVDETLRGKVRIVLETEVEARDILAMGVAR